MVAESGGYPQILVVEDDPAIQALMKVVMGREDHWQTTVVADGRSAIEAWMKGVYGVILLDVRLPDMDGVAVAGKIRELEKLLGRSPTSIIAFSAVPGRWKQQECRDSGFDDFISKPAKMRDVIESVYRHLPHSAS